MSWYTPSTYSELADSIAHGWSWTSSRFGLRGESIAVLSAHCRPGLGLDLSDELSAVVAASAERYAARYMGDGTRTPEPEDVMYFVASPRGQALVAVTASRGIRWSASEHDGRWSERSDIAVAIERLAKRFAGRDDWI